MAIDYTNGGGTGLFDILGKLFYGLKVKNIARGTTVADAVLDAINQYKLKTDADLDLDRDIQGLANAEQVDRENDSLANSYRNAAIALLRGVVRVDSANSRLGLQESLEYLIEQMIADEYYVDDSTASVSISPDGDNSTSDLNIYGTDVGPDGLEIDTVLAETIMALCTTGGDSPVVQLTGERAARSRLAEDWPAGSGVRFTMTPQQLTDGLLQNAGFEDAAIDDTPDNWLVEVGTPGTTVTLTDPTVQTVIISGTPTSGSYYLKVTNPFTSIVHATETLAYNATSADVQAALRAIPGFELTEVAESGTTPNLTHTVTFTGFAGIVTQMASTESFDTGSIAHAVTTTGELGSNAGRSLVLKAHASELTALYQPVTLEPEVVYSISAWMGPTAAAASVNLLLLDGIGGAAIVDNQGASQGLGMAPAGAESRQHFQGFVRVAKNTPMPIYVKLVKASAHNAGDLVLDEIILAPAVQAYPGGPYLAVHTGRIGPASGDKWEIAVGNNYGGEFQKFFDSVFNMSSFGLLLPTSGSTQIPDSLIA